MKLYESRRAPNPRRVRWVMAEKGVTDVELVEIDLLAGEHRTPAYRAKFGVPHVPALELDDGTCLSESIAICRYLEALSEGAGHHRDVDAPVRNVSGQPHDAERPLQPSGPGRP